MKEREVVLKQRVLDTVSGSLSGYRYQLEPEVGSRVECPSKSGDAHCALGMGMLYKTSCIPSRCFPGTGEGSCLFIFILVWF